ncbi:hypothetical protein [Limnobacter sp.]|uniref:hypothetical protein n=1 Tax=Limnobacter sp. TaxID=2003368 RepID=UPI0027BAF2F6|nr:hypothetical protein [Limnobacter sp.]
MSLTTCKSCRKPVAKTAKACPNCGANGHRSFMSRHPIGSLFLGCGVLFAASVIISAPKPTPSQPLPMLSAAESNAKIAKEKAEKREAKIKQAQEAEHNRNLIHYYAFENDMGETIKTASLESRNSFVLPFPHENKGGTFATLMFSKDAKTKKINDFLIALTEGQVICHYSDCGQRYRIGEKPAVSFQGLRAADGSSKKVFFPPRHAKAIEEALKRGEKVSVELLLYQDGSRTWSFEPSEPLDENKLLSEKPR